MKSVLNKVNRSIGIFGKLQNKLSKLQLITIYKLFVRPHIDFYDIIYDQVFNNSVDFLSFVFGYCKIVIAVI